MKQKDIDLFKQCKTSFVAELKQKQKDLYEIHAKYNALLRGFHCDHINGDGSVALKKADDWHIICSICNKTEWRRPSSECFDYKQCQNDQCDKDGYLRDGPWGNGTPCPDCNKDLAHSFANQDRSGIGSD